MIFKRMLKFSLCAAMLGATSTAFAQVQLDDAKSTNLTWEKFAENVNNGIGSQQKVDDLTADLASLKDQRNNLTNKYTVGPVEWLSDAYTDAQKFKTAYDDYVFDGNNPQTPKVYYYKKTATGGKKKTSVWISFEDPDNTDYSDVTAQTLYTAIDEIETFGAVYVYFGKDTEGNYNFASSTTGCYTVTTSYGGDADSFVDDVVNSINSLTTMSMYQTNIPTTQYNELTDQIVAIEGGTDSKGNKVDGTLPAAKAALTSYSNVTLTQNIEATKPITVAYTGTINGNGYVITVPANTTLFSKGFSGTLIKVAAILGTDANVASSTTGATIETVATWNGSKGVYYNASGVRNEYESLNELGFAARDAFGIASLGTANAALTKLDPANKVYKLTSYAPTKTTTSYVYIGGVKAEPNMFAQCATSDIKDIPNVFYGADNTCDIVNIVENKEFYAPVNINATKVNYARQLTAGKNNTVCLPFDVDTKDYPNDKICTFEDFAADKFWFTVRTSVLPANTPILWNATTAVDFSKLTYVQIKATPASMIVAGDKGKTEGNQSFGLYKNALPGEINGESAKANVWVLSDGQFQSISVDNNPKNYTVPAFRMCVYSPVTASAPAMAPRAIAFVDEDGNIIEGGSSAVENVAVEAGISIVAGQGEICFTSEADYGNVEVYNLDGGVAAVANVTAGTTYVDLAKGVYVVMGKKMLVK